MAAARLAGTKNVMPRGSNGNERSAGTQRNKRRGVRKKSAPARATRTRAGKAAGNAATDIKSLAQIYAPGAIRELARLSVEAQSEAARISAIDKILDRAGHPIRTMAGTAEKPMEIVVAVSASLDAKLDRIANAIAAGKAED
ncbi:MAG TPA: hypothetical protein VEU95_14565 [Micropepsaceae bacterium]|nr:hypothetical protein [Micropepsaceae bacterium]